MSKRSYSSGHFDFTPSKRQRFPYSSGVTWHPEDYTMPVAVVQKKKRSYKRGGYKKAPRAIIPRFAGGSSKPESKYILISSAVANAGSSGTQFLLNGTTVGSTNGAVVGQKFTMTSVDLKGMYANTIANLQASTGFFGDSAVFRVAIVYDRQSNAGTYGWSDVYTNTGAQGPFSSRSLPYRDRFLVLYDSGPIAISSGGPTAAAFKYYGKMKLDTQKNTGNTGLLTDITSGALSFWIIDNNTTANLPSEYNLTCKVNYTDE